MTTTNATSTGRGGFWATMAPAWWALSTASVLMLGTGCANRTSMTTADQDLAGPVADEATIQRGFDQSVALFSDGGAIAGTPTFRYESKRYMDSSAYYVSDFGIFFANLVTSPFTAFAERGERKYEGVVFVPSHTMNPILPVGAVNADNTSDSPAPVTAEMVDPNPADAGSTGAMSAEVAPIENGVSSQEGTPNDIPEAQQGAVSPTEEPAPAAPTEETMN